MLPYLKARDEFERDGYSNISADADAKLNHQKNYINEVEGCFHEITLTCDIKDLRTDYNSGALSHYFCLEMLNTCKDFKHLMSHSES